jgi:hypothetical protein
MKKYTIYVSQVNTLEGEITIQAENEFHADAIQRELLAEDFNLQQVDSVFTILEIIEEGETE